MSDLSVHQLVKNFQIFVVPMVSPQAVFDGKQEVPTFAKDDPKPDVPFKDSLKFPSEKLVRMDFGVRSYRKLDPLNPKCFETNGAFFLAQLMQRHIFTVVLDLKDGDENKIIYPYGFLPANIIKSGKIFFVDFN